MPVRARRPSSATRACWRARAWSPSSSRFRAVTSRRANRSRPLVRRDSVASTVNSTPSPRRATSSVGSAGAAARNSSYAARPVSVQRASRGRPISSLRSRPNIASAPRLTSTTKPARSTTTRPSGEDSKSSAFIASSGPSIRSSSIAAVSAVVAPRGLPCPILAVLNCGPWSDCDQSGGQALTEKPIERPL